MKLAVGVLVSHGFPVPADFWDSYEQLMHHVASGQTNALLPEDLKVTSVRRIKSVAFPVDFARNDVIRNFLAGEEDWLLFLDCDMTFPPSLVARLLQHDKAVITARYHMRKEPFHAVAYVKHRVQDGPHAYAPVHYGQGLIEIERGGAGALLIRRDVLEAIRFRIGENWFRYQRSGSEPYDFTVSEDFWFYRQAREAGYQCWCDWDVECGHLQTFAITRAWNATYLDAQMRDLADQSPEQRQSVVDSLVVCGFPEGLTLPTGEHVTPYVVTPGER